MGFKLNSFAALLLLIILYFIQQRQRRNTARQQRGCAALVQHQPAEPFFGLDFIMKIHQDIPSLHRFHQDHGHSFQLNTLISPPTIYTVAPENIKVIHTDDASWGIEPQRLPGMEYFCGKQLLHTVFTPSRRGKTHLKLIQKIIHGLGVSTESLASSSLTPYRIATKLLVWFFDS